MPSSSCARWCCKVWDWVGIIQQPHSLKIFLLLLKQSEHRAGLHSVSWKWPLLWNKRCPVQRRSCSPVHAIRWDSSLGNVSIYEVSREEESLHMWYILHFNTGPEGHCLSSSTSWSSSLGYQLISLQPVLLHLLEDDGRLLNGGQNVKFGIIIQCAQLQRSPTQTKHYCADNCTERKMMHLS